MSFAKKSMISMKSKAKARERESIEQTWRLKREWLTKSDEYHKSSWEIQECRAQN